MRAFLISQFIFISTSIFGQAEYLDLVEVNNVQSTEVLDGDSLVINVTSDQYLRINQIFVTAELLGTNGGMWNNWSSISCTEFCASLLGQCLVSNNDLVAKYSNTLSNTIADKSYFSGRTMNIKNKVGMVLPKGQDGTINFNLTNSTGSSFRRLQYRVLISYEIYE